MNDRGERFAASEGRFEETTFTTNVSDLLAGVVALRARVAAPVMLVGHSLGGAAVLAAALRDTEVAAVATIGAPAAPRHVENLLEDGREALERDGTARISIGGRPFTIGRSLLDDLRRSDLPRSLSALRRRALRRHRHRRLGDALRRRVALPRSAPMHTA